jgi:hypothetical protein
MLIKKLVISCSFLIFVSPVFALMCPSNFNEISPGDSVDLVKKQCGNPDGEKTYDSEANLPQEWNYYVRVSPADQATLKTTIAFANGVVTNMSVNGIGVSNTAICGNSVAVGDSEKSVAAACGKPAFINQGTGSQKGSQAGAATKITEFTYLNPQLTTLIFENGLFKERK